MGNYKLTQGRIERFAAHLQREERAAGTIEKYKRDVNAFARWLSGREVNKQRVTEWKEYLGRQGYALATVNSMLAALHSFFKLMGWERFAVKYLKIQRRLFRSPERELGRSEYERLVRTAKEQGKERLSLLLEAICATGIRVSEVRYLTLEAIRKGRAEISLKGKNRVILLPGKLCRKLTKYAKKQKINSGEIFITRAGTGISRKQIWAEMKALCKAAGVESGKVFPHNLRHVFAQTFYQATRDVVKLADILGHTNIETTRVYLLSTGAEHARQLERLGLIL